MDGRALTIVPLGGHVGKETMRKQKKRSLCDTQIERISGKEKIVLTIVPLTNFDSTELEITDPFE